MSSSASEGLLFFALVINGGLAGAIYALIALAFVLVYKASRMINFALGEWIMFGSLLASTGSHAIGLDLGGAVLFGCVGMALLGVAFNAIVLGRLVTRPVISVIMEPDLVRRGFLMLHPSRRPFHGVLIAAHRVWVRRIRVAWHTRPLPAPLMQCARLAVTANHDDSRVLCDRLGRRGYRQLYQIVVAHIGATMTHRRLSEGVIRENCQA